MATRTITVQFVNPPKVGKTFGTIKGTDGNYYNVDEAALANYAKGQTFNVDVKESESNGRVWLWLPKDFNPKTQQQTGGSTQGSNAQANTGSAGNTQQRETMLPGKADRTIFITAIVGRAMGSGKFDTQDIDALVVAADAAYAQHLAE